MLLNIIHRSTLNRRTIKNRTLKNRTIKLSTVCTLFLFSYLAFAQQSIITTGGDAGSGGASFSYSIGQVIYSEVSSPEFSVRQGVQHSYTIEEPTTTLPQNNKLKLVPTSKDGILLISVEEFKNFDWQFYLYDVSGKLYLKGELQEKNTELNLKDFPLSRYALQIKHSDKMIKTIFFTKQ
jgi:hypothetical protein